MEFNIYEIEKKEIKINILTKIIDDLHDILLYKIRFNTKAYIEFDVLIGKLIKERLLCEKEIKENLLCHKNKISNLKVSTKILKKLFNLKKEFDGTSVDKTVTALIDYYEYDKINCQLSKISLISTPKELVKKLLNTKFNICRSEDSTMYIVYATDDLFIENNLEYLDLRNYKEYSKSTSGLYLFSSKFTLADLDDFFTLLNRY